MCCVVVLVAIQCCYCQTMDGHSYITPADDVTSVSHCVRTNGTGTMMQHTVWLLNKNWRSNWHWRHICRAGTPIVNVMNNCSGNIDDGCSQTVQLKSNFLDYFLFLPIYFPLHFIDSKILFSYDSQNKNQSNRDKFLLFFINCLF